MAPGSPRILLVRLSHLGDLVHALPVFHALRARTPGAEIAWAVQREFASLVVGLPGLARVVRFERDEGFSAWGKVWRELRAFEAEWAIDAQGNAKSAAVTLASLAPRRSGLSREDWQEPFASGVLTDCAPRARAPHALERTRALVEWIAPGSAFRRDPALSEVEIEAGRAFVAREFPDAHAPLRLVHLARMGDPRSWPHANAAAWIARTLARGAAVLALSGPAEARELADFDTPFTGSQRYRHWRGSGDLRALAGVFCAAAERGARFLGCDSGPLHLAEACGLEVVCLAGPTDERRSGPYAGRSLRAQHSPECAPCRERECRHADGPVCMSRIQAEDAERALESSLRA
ncbi:MAG: glycosyltransferase family 9 protein [Planctomycetes bacterium]|nr:glycosyltransferase family 9 protein [Planctomycetota bacterium]